MSSKGKSRKIILEQIFRASLHVLQFGISYCVMMMWMYSNGSFAFFIPPPLSCSFCFQTCKELINAGYILICILLGAMTGFGMFTRDMLAVSAVNM